jgi:hypothetical protein
MAMVRDFDRSKPTMLCIHIYRVARARIVLPTALTFVHLRTFALSRTQTLVPHRLQGPNSQTYSRPRSQLPRETRLPAWSTRRLGEIICRSLSHRLSPRSAGVYSGTSLDLEQF